ncbi:MAG: linear amide C-N hydrolase [Lachnospiraceae bacterium]
MKRIKLKYIVYTFFVLLAVVLITFILLFQRNIRTAASVKRLEDGLYFMEYKGDYNLDGFLEQGGASDDLAVAEFVIQDVFHGLLPIDLRGSSFGCSTISARTPEGDAVFGRNFDWGTCTALIVRTNPVNGYDSVSTVNMDFLNLGLDMPEERQIRLLSVAAPFAPMDGMNEKGLCVAVLMIQDSPGFQQDTGKTDLTTTTAVRLLLDKASDVEEALELLSRYDMHASAGMMVHFALADASGHSVVVEYIDNEMVVTETPAVTNYYLSPGEKYGIGTEESKIRYAMLEDMLRNGSLFSMEGIRDALDSVSKHNFDSEFASTEWSIVYNQSTGEARYYHRENYEKYYSFMAGSP